MIQKIYFDNAATTALHPLVKEAMLPYLSDNYGNPSSTHSYGRKARTVLERARKSIATMVHAAPAEIFFTSGGTESDNTALVGHVIGYKTQHIITSKLEHHAVGHTLAFIAKEWGTTIHYLNHNERGDLDMDHLSALLQKYPKALVALMHANNEIGNIYDIKGITSLVKEHQGYMHSDTVQTVGHFPIDFEDIGLDYASASAHKFHGPKGIGMLYAKKGHHCHQLIHGGGQERDFRGGTENVLGIVGMEAALRLSYDRLEADKNHILTLKKKMIELLQQYIPNVVFNGRCSQDDSLYTVLNVDFPYNQDPEMLVFKMDIAGIACSAGSACSSGSEQGSTVIHQLKGNNKGFAPLRFSFSQFNTIQEVEAVVNTLKQILQ